MNNPDISANVRAIDEVCDYICFVAQTDGGEYIGYWRGPENLPINLSPLVYYDTEGQFELCGSRFVESIFFLVYDEELLKEFRDLCSDQGIDVDFSSLDDIPIPELNPTPDDLHSKIYESYLANT